MLRKLLLSLLVVANAGLVLGLAHELMPLEKQALAQDLAPGEYLIVPVSNAQASVLVVVHSQKRKLLLCSVQGQQLRTTLPVKDLTDLFTK